MSETEQDPHSMPHFRRMLDKALERVWWRNHGEAYRKTVAEFKRCERERSGEPRRVLAAAQPSEQNETPVARLPVRDYYCVREIAAAMGVTPRRARQLLSEAGVSIPRETDRKRIRVQRERLVSALSNLH